MLDASAMAVFVAIHYWKENEDRKREGMCRFFSFSSLKREKVLRESLREWRDHIVGGVEERKRLSPNGKKRLDVSDEKR